MTSSESERYRREQEEFVSNNGGSSSMDVLLAILPNVCGVILTASTLGLFSSGVDRNVRIFVEFCFNIVPCVLCCTILSEYRSHVCLTMIIISIINGVVIILRSAKVDNKRSYKIDIEPAITSRRPFVTNFRALTNIITAVCVLAVDFRIFPRKFAKTEVYGYSLMDTGVGLFVIANALVAPEARDFSEPPKKQSLVRTLMKNSKACVRNCTPLLILGFGRFLAVEYSGYQKHVTEYGVHWNFFVTLAFVKMFTSTIATAVNSRYSLLSGIWILAMHEYALSTKGLKEWVLGDSPRDDFVSANREGLVSVPGYVGLYLVGVAVGRMIHSTYGNMKQRSKFLRERKLVTMTLFGRTIEFGYNESMVLCLKLTIINLQAWIANYFCDKYFQISRRLTNSGYCAWILTLSCVVLNLLLLVEIKTDVLVQAKRAEKNAASARGTKRKHVGFELDETDESLTLIPRTPEIFEAVNYNGLAFFLLANLFTGIVNMSVKTLYVERYQALEILFCYIGLCHFIAIVLYRYKVQIKM